MGWFWAESSSAPAYPATKDHAPASSSRRACPVDHSRFRNNQQDCPAHGRPRNPLNPRNMMPDLPNHPSAANLPTNREISTIPMNERGELWEYPSPQQMLNAMTRKGYDTENPEDVPAMVAVHNFINEGSWDQVLRWEKKYFPENEKPHLIEFKGRPGEPTPKSRFLYWTGRVPKAFDHHEWIVSTEEPGGKRRYVIDYYGLDDLTFSVDARPAVDNFATLRARALNLFDSLKAKASGEPKRDEKVTKFDTE